MTPNTAGEPKFNPWFCQGCGRNAPELKRDATDSNKCPACLRIEQFDEPDASPREDLYDNNGAF